MTNEEAIRVLNVAKAECEWNAPLEYQEAFDAAIKALIEQSKHNQNTMSKQPDLDTLGIKTGETCADTISRQDAIDALREAENHAFNSFYKGLVKAHKIIADIPSAQPEIIRCKDCKHKYVEDMIWHCPFGLMGGENFFCGYGSLGTVERGTDG